MSNFIKVLSKVLKEYGVACFVNEEEENIQFVIDNNYESSYISNMEELKYEVENYNTFYEVSCLVEEDWEANEAIEEILYYKEVMLKVYFKVAEELSL